MGYRVKMILGSVEALLGRLRVSAMALEALAGNAAQDRLPAAARREADFVVIVVPMAMLATTEVNWHARPRISHYRRGQAVSNAR